MTKYEIKLCSWLHKLQDIRADVDKMWKVKSEEYKNYHSNEAVLSEQGRILLYDTIKLDYISDELAEAINHIKVIQTKNQF